MLETVWLFCRGCPLHIEKIFLFLPLDVDRLKTSKMYIFRSLRTDMFLMKKFKLLANNKVSVAAGSGKLQQSQCVLQNNLISAIGVFWTFFHCCGSAMRIRIQGFDDQKLKKIYSWNFFIYFFGQNFNLIILRPLQKTSKLQEKSSSLKKEHPALTELEI